MKKTIKDIEKYGTTTYNYLKTGIYYLFIPVVVGMGLKSIDFTKIFAPQ